MCGSSTTGGWDRGPGIRDREENRPPSTIPRPSTLGPSHPTPDTRSLGFDVVIGNPPYVRQETLGELKGYLQAHYRVYHGVADLYAYFIERGLSLLRPGGLFSYIVANKWLRANYGGPLRAWLKEQEIEEIVDFGDLPVFKQATTYPCILRVRKGEAARRLPGGMGQQDAGAPEDLSVVQVKTLDFPDLTGYVHAHAYTVPRATLEEGGWSLAEGGAAALLAKLRAVGLPLGEYVRGRIYYGIKTGLNEAFVIDAATRDRLIQEDPQSADLIVPFLAGRDIKRYEPPTSERYLVFTRRGVDIKRYPAIERHLAQFKPRLMPKPKDWKGEWQGRKPGPYQWYEIQDTIDYWREFAKPKIIFPDISNRGNFMLDESGSYYSVNTTYIVPVGDKYLLALLNSALMTHFYKTLSATYRGGYLRFIYQYVVELPIRVLDLSSPAERAQHDALVAQVERMLALHVELAAARLPQAKEQLQRQIAATDREIDRQVYALYGLTEEEVRVVESS